MVPSELDLLSESIPSKLLLPELRLYKNLRQLGVCFTSSYTPSEEPQYSVTFSLSGISKDQLQRKGDKTLYWATS